MPPALQEGSPSHLPIVLACEPSMVLKHALGFSVQSVDFTSIACSDPEQQPCKFSEAASLSHFTDAKIDQ